MAEEATAENRLCLNYPAAGTDLPVIDGLHSRGVLDYIECTEGVAQFGRIERVVKWDDVTELQNLITKSQNEVVKTVRDAMQYGGQSIEIRAIDLHDLGVDVARMRIGNKYTVSSYPHGFVSSGNVFRLMRIELDLTNPGNSVYTFQLVTNGITDMQNGVVVTSTGSSNINSQQSYSRAIEYTDTAIDSESSDLNTKIDDISTRVQSYQTGMSFTFSLDANDNMTIITTALKETLTGTDYDATVEDVVRGLKSTPILIGVNTADDTEYIFRGEYSQYPGVTPGTTVYDVYISSDLLDGKWLLQTADLSDPLILTKI